MLTHLLSEDPWRTLKCSGQLASQWRIGQILSFIYTKKNKSLPGAAPGCKVGCRYEKLFASVVGKVVWGRVKLQLSRALPTDPSSPNAFPHPTLLLRMLLTMYMCAQLCPPLCSPLGCSLPGSSDCGISQARILEWVAVSYFRGSSQPRDQTCIFCIGRRILYQCITWGALILGV